MGEEMEKKEKQLRFYDKLNRKIENDLKKAHKKIDVLEMDNYVLRE